MAPHSSTLAWQIPWREEPGGLKSMGSLGVGHDWATSLSLFTFMHWRRKWQPLQCFCLENPRDGGAWWAAVYGVAQSWTRLKRLSSSSSSKDTVKAVGSGYSWSLLTACGPSHIKWLWQIFPPWRKLLVGQPCWRRGMADTWKGCCLHLKSVWRRMMCPVENKLLQSTVLWGILIAVY